MSSYKTNLGLCANLFLLANYWSTVQSRDQRHLYSGSGVCHLSPKNPLSWNILSSMMNCVESSVIDELCWMMDVEARQQLFCLVFITDRRILITRLSTIGTDSFRLPLLVSGIVYPSTSLLHLHRLFSGHDSKLISSPFPIPVPDLVKCSCSNTCHFGHFNRSCYSLTY